MQEPQGPHHQVNDDPLGRIAAPAASITMTTMTKMTTARAVLVM